jgi:hypothetical protein
MDFALLLIPFCVAFELYYLLHTDWKPPLSKSGRVLTGLSGLALTAIFLLLVQHYDSLYGGTDGIRLPALGIVLKNWGIAATLLVGTVLNLGFIVFSLASRPTTNNETHQPSQQSEAPITIPAALDGHAGGGEAGVTLRVTVPGVRLLIDRPICLLLDDELLASGSCVAGLEKQCSIPQGQHRVHIGAEPKPGSKMSKVLGFTAERGKALEIVFEYSRSWGNYKGRIQG